MRGHLSPGNTEGLIYSFDKRTKYSQAGYNYSLTDPNYFGLYDCRLGTGVKQCNCSLWLIGAGFMTANQNSRIRLVVK